MTQIATKKQKQKKLHKVHLYNNYLNMADVLPSSCCLILLAQFFSGDNLKYWLPF